MLWRKVLEKALDTTDFAWFTTVADYDDYELLKAGWGLGYRAYKRDVEREAKGLVEFWQRYAGLSEERSKRINKAILNAIEDGTWRYKEKLVRRIMKAGNVSRERAELIVKTELSNFANRVREEMYKRETSAKKFVWITERDERVCDVCKRMESMCAKGVTLDEMKSFIKMLGGRDWILHPQCRCTFVRKHFKAPRKWEFV